MSAKTNPPPSSESSTSGHGCATASALAPLLIDSAIQKRGRERIAVLRRREQRWREAGEISDASVICQQADLIEYVLTGVMPRHPDTTDVPSNSPTISESSPPELMTDETRLSALRELDVEAERVDPGHLARVIQEQAATIAQLREALAQQKEMTKRAVEDGRIRVPSGQVEEDEHLCKTVLNVANAGPSGPISDDCYAALLRLATKAQGYEAMKAQLETAQHEVAQMDAALRVKVPEIESMITSTCVWCGTPAPTPTTAETLTAHVVEHVAVCEKHPMRALEERMRTCFAELTYANAKINTLAQERDAAVADNAALLRALHGARNAHANGCRESGIFGQVVRPCPCGLDVLLASARPSAALLAEHAKALVRARNEGREEAVEAVRWCAEWGAWALNDLIARIRAKKEAES